MILNSLSLTSNMLKLNVNKSKAIPVSDRGGSIGLRYIKGTTFSRQSAYRWHIGHTSKTKNMILQKNMFDEA
jgi:hypothetical protein